LAEVTPAIEEGLPSPSDPRLMASVDLIRRTGALGFQFRFSDDEDPTVWMCLALYQDRRWEVAAGHEPLEAVYRLLEALIDGGKCTHCRRPSVFLGDSMESFPELVCAYSYDPELQTFRRGCEGDA
jgi:hypothetical protein